MSAVCGYGRPSPTSTLFLNEICHFRPFGYRHLFCHIEPQPERTVCACTVTWSPHGFPKFRITCNFEVETNICSMYIKFTLTYVPSYHVRDFDKVANSIISFHAFHSRIALALRHWLSDGIEPWASYQIRKIVIGKWVRIVLGTGWCG